MLKLSLSTKITLIPTNYYHDLFPGTPDFVTDTVENQIRRFLPYMRRSSNPKLPYETLEYTVEGRPVTWKRRVEVVNPTTGKAEVRVMLVAMESLNDWHKLVTMGSNL